MFDWFSDSIRSCLLGGALFCALPVWAKAPDCEADGRSSTSGFPAAWKRQLFPEAVSGVFATFHLRGRGELFDDERHCMRAEADPVALDSRPFGVDRQALVDSLTSAGFEVDPNVTVRPSMSCWQ